MYKYPKVLASSIIRTSVENEVHGYLYLIDTETETIIKTLSWDNPKISFEGRGGQRGLRGIAFNNQSIYIGSGYEILELNQNFDIIGTFSNQYLSDIHEMEIVNDCLAVVSSGYDALILFDLKTKTFTKGYSIDSLNMRYKKNYIYKLLNKYYPNVLSLINPIKNYKLNIFDPAISGQILNTSVKKNRLHINTVSPYKGGWCLSGTMSNYQFFIKNDTLKINSTIPLITHNVLNFSENSILYNSTNKEEVIWSKKNGKIIKRFKNPTFETNQLQNSPNDKTIAKVGWARGLCWTNDKKMIISGTSPASIMLYDTDKGTLIKTIQLSKDVRNAIHGLEIYPY